VKGFTHTCASAHALQAKGAEYPWVQLANDFSGLERDEGLGRNKPPSDDTRLVSILHQTLEEEKAPY
jgi:hypothetical protein